MLYNTYVCQGICPFHLMHRQKVVHNIPLLSFCISFLFFLSFCTFSLTPFFKPFDPILFIASCLLTLPGASSYNTEWCIHSGCQFFGPNFRGDAFSISSFMMFDVERFFFFPLLFCFVYVCVLFFVLVDTFVN